MHKVGRNSLKYLKKWWNRTEGRGHKDFKNGGGGGGGRGGEGGGRQAEARSGGLKKGGGRTPLRTMCIEQSNTRLKWVS